MPTNKQRREAERRRLQRQLEERRQKEASRKHFTLIASIVGTVVLIAAVVVIIVATTGGSDSKNTAAGGTSVSPGATSSSAAASSSPPASSSAAPVAAPVACTGPKGATVTYKGVTVAKANDISHEPKVTSKSTTDPKALECQDLVVGKGKPATPTSTVSVQYTGVLYKDGKQFDSSWASGKPISFPLTGVVPGFTQGIGGTGKVAPMRVGGRRIMILPASLGYGAQAQGTIPANSSLVFVVDLKSVS